MQVIPENLNITTGYHVFETPDDIIINSQIYDKITMEPKPYNFFNVNYKYQTYENILLHCYTKLNHYTMLPKEINYKRYIQDSIDPNIFYFCNLYGYFVKVKKEKEQYKLISAIRPDSGYRPNSYNYEFYNYKILGQTDKYVILAQTHKGDNGGGTPSYKMFSILRINKSTMTHDATYNVGTYLDYGVSLIKEFSNHIYIFGVFNGHYYIGLYKADTNSLTWIYSNTVFDQATSIGVSDIIEFRNDFYFITSYGTNYILRKIMINYNNNSVSTKDYNIGTHTNFPFKAPNSVCYLGWLHYSLYNIENKYISITSHDAENQVKITSNTGNQRPANYFSSQGFHRHMICKYNENNDSFSIVSTINDLGTNRKIFGVLYPTPYHIFFLEDSNVTGYYFDKSNNTIKQIFNKTGNYYTIGLDETKRFYIFDNQNHCNIYNKYTSNELYAEFEKETYEYENKNIDTYITIYSKNFLGEYINSKVQITLTGNCCFKENNSKEIIITTKEELTKIPVIITNGGTVYCDIKEVE